MLEILSHLFSFCLLLCPSRSSFPFLLLSPEIRPDKRGPSLASCFKEPHLLQRHKQIEDHTGTSVTWDPVMSARTGCPYTFTLELTPFRHQRNTSLSLPFVLKKVAPSKWPEDLWAIGLLFTSERTLGV